MPETHAVARALSDVSDSQGQDLCDQPDQGTPGDGTGGLRERLGNLTRRPLIDACAALRPGVPDGPMTAAKRALRTLARRIQSLEQEIELLLSDLDSFTQAVCPGLRQTYGVGVDSAATLLTAAGDNPERLRSDAGFAALCGVSPLPASSGKTNRHRLNRGGNRQANAALHRVAVVRLRWDEQTQAYAARRIEEGLSKPEILRCRKRFIAGGSSGFCWATHRFAPEGPENPDLRSPGSRQAARPLPHCGRAAWRIKSRPPHPLGIGKSDCQGG